MGKKYENGINRIAESTIENRSIYRINDSTIEYRRRIDEIKAEAKDCMVEKQFLNCSEVIESAVLASSAAVMKPIPVVDKIKVGSENIGMINKLERIFDYKIPDIDVERIIRGHVSKVFGKYYGKFFQIVIGRELITEYTELMGWRIALFLAQKSKDSFTDDASLEEIFASGLNEEGE